MSLILVGGNALADEANSASIVQGVTAGAGASIDSHDQNTSNVYDRKFVNPGVYPMPQTNGFFTSPTPDSSFRGMEEFLAIFGDGKAVILSDGAVDQMAKGGFDTEVNYQIVNDETIVPRVTYDGTKYIKITIEKPADVKVVALVDGEADDNDTNSMMVLGQMAQEAIKDGCNVLVITAEGAHRAVEASGWGVGTAVTGGAVNTSGKESVAGGGGTGYSSNGTMTEDLPWLQGFAAVDYDAPELAKVVAAAAPAPQTGNHTKYGSLQAGN